MFVICCDLLFRYLFSPIEEKSPSLFADIFEITPPELAKLIMNWTLLCLGTADIWQSKIYKKVQYPLSTLHHSS